MIVSIIDIGTKSLKHYIFNVSNVGKELLNYKRYSEANLGADENINPETEERLFSIIKNCLDANNSLGVKKLKIVGTEIFRNSDQAKQLAIKIKNLTGVEVEILDQEKEAYYLYNGFVGLVGENIDFAATNIGGGSTEIILGNNDNLKYSQKLSFGVNFLKNTFGGAKMDWKLLDEYLDKRIDSYAGNANNLFITGILDFLSIVAPQLGFNFNHISMGNHSLSLGVKDYQALVMKLRETPIETLRNFYSKDPDFADNVAIGQSVYLKIAEKLGSSIIIPSNNDLTDGIIKEIINAS